MIEERIIIAIAESAPIISAGLAHTVSRLPGLPVRAIEIKDASDLKDCILSQKPDILIINPHFGNQIDTALIQSRHPDLKIMAIASAPLDRQTCSRFDGIISIADDVDLIAEKIKKTLSVRENEPAPDNREPLSNREKEIIINVVKGYTNKEIADKLFLSVHTVITHRRNIARKLEIHSATGLTIYAIVNKLVDISELHL